MRKFLLLAFAFLFTVGISSAAEPKGTLRLTITHVAPQDKVQVELRSGMGLHPQHIKQVLQEGRTVQPRELRDYVHRKGSLVRSYEVDDAYSVFVSVISRTKFWSGKDVQVCQGQASNGGLHEKATEFTIDLSRNCFGIDPDFLQRKAKEAEK